MSAAISPDSRTLAVGVASGNLLLWSLRERYPFEHRQAATEMFEPDVSFTAAGALVTQTHDRTRPFHPTTESFRTNIDGVDDLRDVATSADGAWLATAGKHAFDANHYWFGRVGLWDRHMHRLVGFPLDSDPNETTSIAFSADGAHLAASGPHGIAKWDLAPSSLRTAACRVANRNLTRSEWLTYLGAGTPYRAMCLKVPAADE